MSSNLRPNSFPFDPPTIYADRTLYDSSGRRRLTHDLCTRRWQQLNCAICSVYMLTGSTHRSGKKERRTICCQCGGFGWGHMVNWKHRRGYECFNPECWHVIDATCGECEEVVMKVYDGE